MRAAFEPLPQDTNSDLQMLVVAILNKDYLKRPTIFEVAAIPCVKNEILNFINTHNCQDELFEIMDLINPQVEPEIECSQTSEP